MKLQFYVYEYLDPRNGTHRYIGEGQGRRAYEHLKKADNSELASFIAELRALGLKPIINITEHFATKAEACACEEELITLHGRLVTGDGSLFNILPRSGGMDEETMRRQKEGVRRLWSDPEYREQRNAALRLRHADPEFQKLREEGIRLRETNPEYRKRRGEAARENMRLLKADPEFQKRQIECNQQLHADPEFQKRQAEGTRRYWERKRQEKALALSLPLV